MADVHSPSTRSYNMSRIKSKNTKIEALLAKRLWACGYRYRRNDKSVPGKPDFTFKKYKVAIFCDSEFWHGKDFEEIKNRIGTNKEFWVNKIQKNIERDKKYNKELSQSGWVVLRFWEKDIKKNIDWCMNEIDKIFTTFKTP